MMELAMKKMILNVSDMLTPEELNRMKYAVKDIIPLRRRTEITSTIDLFNELEQRGKYKYNDVSFIQYLLENVCPRRCDILKEFAAYSQSKKYLSTVYFDAASSQNPIQTDAAEPLPESGSPNIFSRDDWGAREPKKVTYLTHNQPLPYVIIQHSADAQCIDLPTCIKRVRSYQRYHMVDKGWDDIGYSFVIGGDGSTFEARGWDRQGSHTYKYNDRSIGICFIGNFQDIRPSQAQLNAAQTLIELGISLGKISPKYNLLGHRDVRDTNSPGDKLYAIIQDWPHYNQILK